MIIAVYRILLVASLLSYTYTTSTISHLRRRVPDECPSLPGVICTLTGIGSNVFYQDLMSFYLVNACFEQCGDLPCQLMGKLHTFIGILLVSNDIYTNNSR